MAEPSLRETIEASFKDVTDEPKGDPVDSPVAPAGGEPAEPPAGDSPGTDGGVPGVSDTPVDGAAESKPYLDDKQDGKPAQPVDPNAQPAQPAQPAQSASDLKAPLSWRVDLRDAFKALPEQVQKEIIRREDDVRRFVQETASYRKYIEDFERVCEPYRQIIAMEGGEPLKSFGDYLRTASLLRIGTPVEKANALASAVKQFGVDVHMLDSALAAVFNGQPMPQSQGNGNGQYRDPRVDELIDALKQSRESRQQEMENRQIAEIQTFQADPKNEFFDYLRKDIADLLDFNANRGVRMTIQQAYEMAAQMHPEISKIYLQKKAEAQAAASQQMIANKRRAAVGAPGAPDVGTQPRQNDTLRGAIEAAMNQHQQPV